jgi:hypothetical protein
MAFEPAVLRGGRLWRSLFAMYISDDVGDGDAAEVRRSYAREKRSEGRKWLCEAKVEAAGRFVERQWMGRSSRSRGAVPTESLSHKMCTYGARR